MKSCARAPLTVTVPSEEEFARGMASSTLLIPAPAVGPCRLMTSTLVTVPLSPSSTGGPNNCRTSAPAPPSRWSASAAVDGLGAAVAHIGLQVEDLRVDVGGRTVVVGPRHERIAVGEGRDRRKPLVVRGRGVDGESLARLIAGGGE